MIKYLKLAMLVFSAGPLIKQDSHGVFLGVIAWGVLHVAEQITAIRLRLAPDLDEGGKDPSNSPRPTPR